MIQINSEQCIGCGLCVKDCIANNLRIKENNAEALFECILCGHCVAVCPQNAVTIPEYADEELLEFEPQAFNLNPEALLNSIRFRRSIRQYKPLLIEDEILEALIEAGRFTATAKNSQGNRFIIVQEQLNSFKEMIWSTIEEAVNQAKENPEQATIVGFEDYHRFYRTRKRHPENDFLFRNAPAVLFVTADTPTDAALAAQNIELMAISLGLGVLYNGFLKRAAAMDSKILDWLGASDKTDMVCMLIGYPAVQYARTAPRKKADAIIK